MPVLLSAVASSVNMTLTSCNFVFIMQIEFNKAQNIDFKIFNLYLPTCKVLCMYFKLVDKTLCSSKSKALFRQLAPFLLTCSFYVSKTINYGGCKIIDIMIFFKRMPSKTRQTASLSSGTFWFLQCLKALWGLLCCPEQMVHSNLM